jgi:hypothetical protein
MIIKFFLAFLDVQVSQEMATLTFAAPAQSEIGTNFEKKLIFENFIPIYTNAE